jgi:ATP-dependent DNA helicase RecG
MANPDMVWAAAPGLTANSLAKSGRIESQARIDIMRQSEDGFLIAEEDLKLRGEGDVLGTRQSGMPGFKFAVPEKHGDLLATARDDAKLTLLKDPKLESPRGQALRHLLYLFERDAAIKLLRAG